MGPFRTDGTGGKTPCLFFLGLNRITAGARRSVSANGGEIALPELCLRVRPVQEGSSGCIPGEGGPSVSVYLHLPPPPGGGSGRYNGILSSSDSGDISAARKRRLRLPWGGRKPASCQSSRRDARSHPFCRFKDPANLG